MDLRSGKLYWPDTCDRPSLPTQSPRRLDLDALVVGTGVTGAMVADELTRRGARVALMDRRLFARGSTPASTALLQYELDTPLVELRARLGDQHADAAYLDARRALDGMVRLCDGLGDVELAWKSSLQLARRAGERPALEREVAARQSIGIEAEVLDAPDLRQRFGVERPTAIFSRRAIQLNPLKLTYALLERALDRGAILLPQAALNFEPLISAAPPFHIEVVPGTMVRTASIVVATGYETPKQFAWLARLTELRSTYAMVTFPVDTDLCTRETLIWETGDPYLYVRSTPDRRLMVGGEDEDFVHESARDVRITEKAGTLRERVSELFAIELPTVAYRWAGTFARSSDGLPFIDEPDRLPGMLFALGYGGNGITFSVIAARAIGDHLEGRAALQDGLYSFLRRK